MNFFHLLFKKILDLLFPRRSTELFVDAADQISCYALMKTQQNTIGDMCVYSLLPYKAPLVQALCIEAKFHKNAKAYVLLGSMLALYLKHEVLIEAPQNVVIVPIPLGALRRAERGYNQVEEITKSAAKFLNVDSKRVIVNREILTRSRETIPQMTLDKVDRLKNMADVFEVRAAICDDTLYIVIDDVVTTGATLAAAHSAFKRAGARHILLLAIAH
jgi:ComF family protein